MPKKLELLECHHNEKPGKEFLLEYQKSVLLALEQEGILDCVQLDLCIRKLENQGNLFRKEAVL